MVGKEHNGTIKVKSNEVTGRDFKLRLVIINSYKNEMSVKFCYMIALFL